METQFNPARETNKRHVRAAELPTTLLFGQAVEGVDAEILPLGCFALSLVYHNQLETDGSGLRVSFKSVSAAVKIVQACSYLGNLDFSSNRGSTPTGYPGTQVGSLNSSLPSLLLKLFPWMVPLTGPFRADLQPHFSTSIIFPSEREQHLLVLAPSHCLNPQISSPSLNYSPTWHQSAYTSFFLTFNNHWPRSHSGTTFSTHLGTVTQSENCLLELPQ